jgi:hypothetical protein
MDIKIMAISIMRFEMSPYIRCLTVRMVKLWQNRYFIDDNLYWHHQTSVFSNHHPTPKSMMF